MQLCAAKPTSPGRFWLSQNSPLRAARTTRQLRRQLRSRNRWNVSGMRIAEDKTRVGINYPYTYDLDGNRTKETQTTSSGTTTTTYTYNGDDEMTSQTVGGTTTDFTYDANGSQLTNGATTYTYNVRNQLNTATTNGVTTSYAYDDTGDRVQETTSGTTTYYLIDDQNPTGYSKPIQQSTSAGGAPTITYIIGDRVLAQANGSGAVTYLLADGNGDTRALVSSSGAVTATFNYDSFGDPIGFNPATAGTIWLLGDALYDAPSGLEIHGSGRPENAGTGRFVIANPPQYSSIESPITLNAYILDNDDPVNNSDPTGWFTTGFGNAAHARIGALYQLEYPTAIINPTIGVFGVLKPDILDVFRFKYAEIKPFTLYGITTGFLQIEKYDRVYGPGALNYSRDTSWPGGGFNFTVVNGVELFFWNVDGIIFYTDQTEEADELEDSVKNEESALKELENLEENTNEADESIEDSAEDQVGDIEGEAAGEAEDVGLVDNADLGAELGIDVLDGLEGAI
jgi:hypothetical protein